MRHPLLIALLLSAASASPTYADDNDAEAVRKALDALRQGQEAMARQQAALEERLQKLSERDLERAVDRKVAREKKKISLDLEYKDGFKMASRDKRFAFQVGGRLQVDYRHHLNQDGGGDDHDDDNTIDTFRIRRARIFTAGTLYKYYKWKVQVDFAGGGASLQSGYMDVVYTKKAALRLGQYTQPFGLEELTSTKYIKPLERSMVTNFITPGKDVGARLSGDLLANRLHYDLAVFNGNGSNRTDENDSSDHAARIVIKPFADSDNTLIKGLHFGAAVTHGIQDGSRAGSGPRTAIGKRVWTYGSGVRAQDKRIRHGLEFAWHGNPWGISAEWMDMREELTLGSISRQFKTSGWYVTLNYFLTGEATSFKRVHPLRLFDPDSGDGGLGAWELAMRAGVIQIDHHKDVDGFFTGAERAHQYMGGVNWYPNPMVRFSLQLVHGRFTDKVLGIKHETAIFFRAQIEY